MEKMETKQLHDNFSLQRFEVKIQVVGSKASITDFLKVLSRLGRFWPSGGFREATKEDRGSYIKSGLFIYETNRNKNNDGERRDRG